MKRRGNKTKVIVVPVLHPFLSKVPFRLLTSFLSLIELLMCCMLNKTLWNSHFTTTFARKTAFNFPFEMSRFSLQDVRHLNVSLWYTQQTHKTTTLENQLRSLTHIETMNWKASQMPPFIAPSVKSLALVGNFCDVKGLSRKNALPETLESLKISCCGPRIKPFGVWL